MGISQQELISTACALLCASIGSIHDVRERKIPNRLCGLSILAGLALHMGFAGWRGVAESAMAGLIAGALALIFWIAGGMGAGDVKLLAAIGCLTGFLPLRMVLLSTVVAGGVFALAMSAYHGRLRETLGNVSALIAHHRHAGLRPHPELNVRGPRSLCIPFALPVAAGCLFTLCTLVWGVQS